MLELLKELLNINTEDTSKDTILNFYIEKSTKSIKHYLNIDMTEEEKEEYNNQIVDLAHYYYVNKSSQGYKQFTQGSRSVTLSNNIPDTIKIQLPPPRVKVVGWLDVL